MQSSSVATAIAGPTIYLVASVSGWPWLAPSSPRVLLLDEPLSSLDPVLRSELQQLICLVQRSLKITSVFVTHDRDEAHAVADEVAVMLDGQVQQVGAPSQVFAQPATDAVAAFLGRATRVTT